MGTFKDTFKRSPLDIGRDKETEQNKKDILDLKDHLENLKSNLLKNVRSPQKRDETTTSIQLLILHYLGYLDIIKNDIKDNKKIAPLLSVLFNTEGSENIRKKLSNVGGKGSSLMTSKNLNYIKDLFESLGLEEPLKKVKKQLAKMPASED